MFASRLTKNPWPSEVDGNRAQPERGVPAHGRRGLAHEHVHLAGLECRKALLTGERDKPHLGGITQDGCGDGPADVRVESAPSALTVGLGEACHTGVHPTGSTPRACTPSRVAPAWAAPENPTANARATRTENDRWTTRRLSFNTGAQPQASSSYGIGGGEEVGEGKSPTSMRIPIRT